MIDDIIIEKQLELIKDAHEHTTEMMQNINKISGDNQTTRVMLNQNIIMNSISILLLKELEK